MKIVFDQAQLAHYPRHFLVRGQQQPNPEKPQRAERLLAAATAAGHDVVTPFDYGLAPLAGIHTPEYLSFLAGIHRRWQSLPDAGEEIIPNVHPEHRAGRYPEHPVGQAGYHQSDTACPISADTWQAACASANSAVHAADLVGQGFRSVYALCRPPGHHAYADRAGGFCYLNNSAIAAQRLRRQHERVAILDVDVHHGNGTQGVFYSRPDVLTVSLHADPNQFYPFFQGHADERGEGPGLGYNCNLPLPLGTGDADYLHALRAGLERLRTFAPGALVVALGLDAYQGDPLRGLAISTPGFAAIGQHIAAAGLPTVLVQEGGYLSDELGPNLVSFLGGFEVATSHP